MKKILFVLILCPGLALTQDYLPIFDRYNPTYHFKWNGFESSDSYEVKDQFEAYIKANKLMQGILPALEFRNKQLKYEVAAVDLNDDGLTDIICEGPHMGEGSVVEIYLQSETGFEEVLSTGQGIATVDWEGEKLDKIYLKDWGCCAAQTLSNTVYQVIYKDQKPVFTRIWKSIELIGFITKPKSTFVPKRFEITNEQYKLRANPWIDDATREEYLELTGNTIGILKQGFKGTAYGSSTDETGRIWWYVVIDNEYEVLDTYVSYENHELKPHLVGWISSRYVKEIED